MRKFSCTCSNTLSFENTLCLQCSTEVGFDPLSGQMKTLNASANFRRCENGYSYGTCNWLIPNSSGDAFCIACNLNQMIPDLTIPDNIILWGKLELAKKRALYSLLHLHLPFHLKCDGQPHGLAFRFLDTVPGIPAITSHEDGVITMNIEEADDVIRERNRQQFHEPYRTLLGHFRHELGHYYWSQWFEYGADDDEPRAAFRSLFGDELADYQEAMSLYYQQGASPDWPQSFVTAYASMHPWEDWAETWAHYLHMMDAVDTARSFHIDIEGHVPVAFYQPSSCVLPQPFDEEDPQEFLEIVNEWIRISPPLNEMASSLGQNMLYPFALSETTIRKMFFIHCMIQRIQSNSGAQAENQPVLIRS